MHRSESKSENFKLDLIRNGEPMKSNGGNVTIKQAML